MSTPYTRPIPRCTDPTTGDQQILAPDRAGREPGGRCPFCPGGEARTPPELDRRSGVDGSWRVRVVANLYPIVSGADGWHEVIVESRRHDWDYPDATPAELADVLATVRGRHRAHVADAAIVTFRNHGARSGASQAHPHTQVVGLSTAPGRLREMWRRAHEHHAATGRSLYEDLVGDAAADCRVVAEAGATVALVPPAPSADHETWIVPTEGVDGDFGAASDADLDGCADLLRTVTGAIEAIHPAVPYRLLLYAAAPAWRGFRWHLRLRPKTAEPGGFEAVTGMSVTTVAPRAAARELRTACRRGGRPWPAGRAAPVGGPWKRV